MFYETEFMALCFGLRLCFYHALVNLHQQTDVVLFLSRNFYLQVGQGACAREKERRKLITKNKNPGNLYLYNYPKIHKREFITL